ncbi:MULTISPECIES: LPD38 domain-containing protein [Pseudomonadaceae]|uniref:LPD38 domain-containing protein n=1 Tax=Pseudomonadaceae TaxID=135621 RepID=UPI000B069DF2|nr:MULTISPECIES: LPD38 domain-containing protein [Pseudomonas]
MADDYDALADIQSRMARKQATLSGEFGKGIASGVDALQGSLYGLAGVVGDVVAEPGLRDWGIAGYLRNQDEAQQNPALVQRVEDVGSLKDAGLYAAQGLGQLVPFAASSIAGGGIGGAAARVAGRSAAEGIVKGGIAQGLERAAAERAGQVAAREMTERGIQAGLAGTSIGTEQGIIYGDIYEKTGQYAPGTALAYGAAAGALDVVPELGLLSKAMRPSKGLLRAAGQQAATEAATEAGQTAVERLAVQRVDPSQEAFNAEGRSELLNAAILGGIGGGILGGGVDAAGRIAQRALQAPASPAAQPPTPEPAGPISRSAALLPGPAPLAALPAPDPVLYGDSSGTIRDTGPVRDVDREQRPVPGREQAQPRSPFGGGGIDQPVPRGVVPLSGELIQAPPPAVRETPPMAVRTFDASPIYPGLPDLRPEAVVVDPSGQASFARVPTPRPVEDQGPSFGAGMDRQAQPAQRPVFSEVLQQARQAQGALDAKALAERTGASRAMATRALAGAKVEQQVTATAYKSVPGANKALRSLPLPDEFEVVKTGSRQWAVQRRPVQERAYVDSGTGPVDERAAGDQGAAPFQPTDPAGVPNAEATPQAPAVQPVESGAGVPPAAAGADGQRALNEVPEAAASAQQGDASVAGEYQHGRHGAVRATVTPTAKGFQVEWGPDDVQQFKGKAAGEKVRAALEREGFNRVEQQGANTNYSRGAYRMAAPRVRKVRAETLARSIGGMVAGWKNAPQVNVVQSIDDLPPRLRQQVKRDGALDAEGLYDPKGVYLIADNLTSLQHAAFVLQHEVIGHAGLQGAFGKRLSPLLLSIYKEHPALRSSADRLRDRFGYDKALAMEEVLADLAAAGRLTEQRFWPRLVAAVRNALRDIGFKVRWTDQDIAALLGTARRFIEKGGDKGTGALVQTYSREPGTGLPATLEKEIDEVFRGKTLTKPLSLGGTPDVLKALGAADAPINITEDTLWKAVDKHSLTPRDVKAALAALGEPVMVFDSATAPDGLVALVETASRGRSVVVAVHMNRAERVTVNRIASIHAKDSTGFIRQWMETGLLRYVDNKKADAWSKARGLQLPKAGPKHRLGKKVLRPEDIGKEAGDVRYSRASQRAADFFDQVTNRGEVRFPEHATSAQRDALGKIGAFIRQEPLAKTARALSERWKEKVIQGVFDQFAPIAKLDQAAYMQARLSKGTDGALEATFFHGRPTITDGALDVEADGQGLRGVLAELKGEHDLFFAWIAGNRAEKLAQEGRENLFTPDDIAALRSLNQGTMDDGRSRAVVYRDVLKHFNAYQKAVMDVAEQAGLIDGSSRKLWESEFYVPFYRVMEEGDGTAGPGQIGGLTGQKAFKKLKGGKEPLGDLMANTLANWSHLLSASMKNMAANKALQAAEQMNIATRVREAEKGSLRVMVNGKERHYLVDDPLVLDALTMLNHQDWNNPAMKAMRSFKHALTVGVTSSPAFRARNLLRDSISSIAANDLGYNPLKNMAAGWKGTGKDSPTLHRLLAGGGAVRFGSLNDGDQATYAKRLISRGVDSSQILNTPAKAAKALRSAWDKYQEIGDRLETVNRAALYEKLRAEGKSHLEASYAARDLMDFTSAGKWASVRFLTQIVPFMNARLQGMYKLGRGASADPRRFLAVAGAVAMASTLLFLLNKDDEEFKQLPDWVRDTYWWVRIPGTEKALYLPKPFEVGVMGSVAERLTELALSGDDYQAGDFASTAGSLLWNQLSMSPVPQAFKPLMEAAFNYDSFRDRPIDSMGQERLPAEERYTARTSASAVAAGQLTGISPQRIEHLVRGYFGWLGTQALNTADYLTRGITDLPSNPKSDLTNPDNWTLFGDFVKAADPGSGSKYLTRFYEMQHQIDQLYASAGEARKVGDLERLQQLAGNEMLKLRPVYQAANRQITAINQRIKAVTNDRSLGAAEKAELLKQLNATRNRAAQLADERGRAAG